MKLKTIGGITLVLLLITVTLALCSSGILSPVRSNVRVFQSESTEWSGYISENTTWTLTSSPHIVVGDVIVEPSAFLTIEPGVMVKFTSGRNLVIYGGLIAQGNATHRITFTTNSATPSREDWGTLRFKGTHLLMSYVLVEYATKGLELKNVANISNSVISNCTVGIEEKLSYANNLTVTDNSADGLNLSSSPPIEIRFDKSVISNNGRNGITVIGNSTINMDNCTVSNNIGNGVILSNGGYIKNSHVIGNSGNGTCILGPTTFDNTTISANGGDGIWMGSSMTIRGCVITENAGNGTSGHLLTHGFSFSIYNCSVSNNGQNGIIASPNGTPEYIEMHVDTSIIINNNMSGLSGRGYVFNSTVSGNKMCGILGNYTVEHYNVIAWNQGGGFNGTGVIYWSSIFNNTPYDVVADVWPNNVTATHNWWGTNESALIAEHIWDHNGDVSLGYVDYSNWLSDIPQPIDTHPPKIVSINWTRTNPPPYNPTALFPQPRIYESVRVSVNVTDDESPIPSGVDRVLLSYRVDGGEWWTTKMTLTMMYNGTSGNWTAIIPPQPGNSTVEFFIQTYDKAGNNNASSIYSYKVKSLPVGDVNGDNYVGIDDIVAVAEHFGDTDP